MELLRGQHPIQVDQSIPQLPVHCDQFRVVTLSQRDVDKIVDRMVVIAARQFPGPTKITPAIDQLDRQLTQQKMRLIGLGTIPAATTNPGQQSV